MGVAESDSADHHHVDSFLEGDRYQLRHLSRADEFHQVLNFLLHDRGAALYTKRQAAVVHGDVAHKARTEKNAEYP